MKSPDPDSGRRVGGAATVRDRRRVSQPFFAASLRALRCATVLTPFAAFWRAITLRAFVSVPRAAESCRCSASRRRVFQPFLPGVRGRGPLQLVGLSLYIRDKLARVTVLGLWRRAGSWTGHTMQPPALRSCCAPPKRDSGVTSNRQDQETRSLDPRSTAGLFLSSHRPVV